MTRTSEITRAGRQARIVAILSAHSVHSQGELAALLADEGVDVTQATLSRDLEELGAVKLRGADGGVGHYVVPEDVKALAVAAFGHRISLRPEMWIRNMAGSDVVEQLLKKLPAPRTPG